MAAWDDIFTDTFTDHVCQEVMYVGFDISVRCITV